MTLSEYMERHELGEKVVGEVVCHQYGCFVALKELDEGEKVLLEIIDFTPESLGLESGSRIEVEDLPEPGEEVVAYLYLYSPNLRQVRLTMWEEKLG